MRVAEIPEWIITLVKAMYDNAKSRVRVDCEHSNLFSVNVSVQQGLVLNPLLFFIVLPALSILNWLHIRLLYADGLVIIVEFLEEVMN